MRLNFQLKYFPTIGTLLPTPNAFSDMRMIGQNWLRLYSFLFTSFNVRSTNAASKPNALISFGPNLRSIYKIQHFIKNRIIRKAVSIFLSGS